MGRGTLGSSRGIAAATSGVVPNFRGLTPQEQFYAQHLENLDLPQVLAKRYTYHIGDRTAEVYSTRVAGKRGKMFAVTTTDAKGNSQTQHSWDFEAIKNIARKHLGV